MANNFTTATIEINEVVEKIKKQEITVANTLAGACIGRAKDGKISANLIDDIDQALSDFSDKDKVRILENTIYSICQNIGGSSNSSRGTRHDYMSSYSDDIFNSRKKSNGGKKKR